MCFRAVDIWAQGAHGSQQRKISQTQRCQSCQMWALFLRSWGRWSEINLLLTHLCTACPPAFLLIWASQPCSCVHCLFLPWSTVMTFNVILPRTRISQYPFTLQNLLGSKSSPHPWAHHPSPPLCLSRWPCLLLSLSPQMEDIMKETVISRPCLSYLPSSVHLPVLSWRKKSTLCFCLRWCFLNGGTLLFCLF